MSNQVNKFGFRKQLGVTLTEFVGVAALAALTFTGTLYINSEMRGYKKVDAAAVAISKHAVAVENFTSKYMYELREGGMAIPGVADPCHPTVSELVAIGMYGTGFNPIDLPGGMMETVIEKVPAGCVTEQCNVAWTTYAPKPFVRANGEPDESAAGRAVHAIGPFAGYSPMSNPGFFKGYNDSWGSSVVNPTGQPAIVAVRGGYGTSMMAKFLRIDGGNEMAADFRGGGHNIVDVKDATFDGNAVVHGKAQIDNQLTVNKFVQPSADPSQLAVAGTPCADGNGAMRSDVNGNILSCQNGVWKSGSNGQYTYVGSFLQNYGATNNSGKTMVVQVMGGQNLGCDNPGNMYSLAGVVNGVGLVAYAVNNNPGYAKVGYISFSVPAGASFTVVSNPYDCPQGGVFDIYTYS